MKRPMRWYWAALYATLASYAVSVVIVFLCVGWPFRQVGLLELALEWWLDAIEEWTGFTVAAWGTVLLLSTPSVLVGMLVFDRLHAHGARHDGHLHCLKCGYILKGLSEPRCPECGEPI
jgi:hypothetical protein